MAPNGNCQNNLESGDVIEGLPNATFPMTMDGFTYHPQNEALLQWFAFESPSSAIGGAYSYPDTTILSSHRPHRRSIARRSVASCPAPVDRGGRRAYGAVHLQAVRLGDVSV